MSDLPKLLTEQEAAEALRVSARTLQGWRVSGGGPRYLKVGAAVRYDRETLDAWLSTRAVASTSAPSAAAHAAGRR